MTVVVEDQVVGAAGDLPTVAELILDHGDLPSELTARNLKK